METQVRQRNLLERVLSVAAEVRAGEGRSVAMLALNVFLLMLAYYLLKTVRDALILAEQGAEVKSYSSAAQAMLFLGIVPVYAAFASRVNRIRLITWVSLFFISNLVVFAALGMAHVREGIAFFIWVGIFNMLVIAQFWAFTNDLHTDASGKRLFPVIMLGASIGAVSGGRIAAWLFAGFGAYGLMLLSACLLVGCIGISRWIHFHAVAQPARVAVAAEEPLSKKGVWELFAGDRYLQLLAVLMVVLNVVNTNGEYVLGKIVAAEALKVVGSNEAARTVFIGEFMGRFSSLYSTVGLLLQLFVVSRVFRFIGVAGALYVLPAIALGGYSLMVVLPVLGVVQWAKILENGTDYSLQNTTRQALFLPTSREAKYKAKAAIDTFFVRGGDMLQAGLVFAATTWLGLGISGFAAINVGLVLVWLGVVMGVSKEYRRRTENTAREIPDGAAVRGATV
ncbi:MAG: Npt1/Npt2 family nucleotide transporter [Acidobacteriota bacterium]